MGTRDVTLTTTVVRFETGDVRRYRHPEIKARFSSRMVNLRNLQLSTSANEALAERVAARLKPITFVDSHKRKEVERWAALARRKRATTLIEKWRETYFLTVAVGGKIGDAFDLSALSRDYLAYLSQLDKGIWLDIDAELRRLAPMAFSDFMKFGRVEVETLLLRDGTLMRRPGSVARCGLLLGYPIATSAALILEDHLGFVSDYHAAEIEMATPIDQVRRRPR